MPDSEYTMKLQVLYYGIQWVIQYCNMYTCSGNCIQERSAGFPMFSLITLLTLISLIVFQPRSYIKAWLLLLSLVLHGELFYLGTQVKERSCKLTIALRQCYDT